MYTRGWLVPEVGVIPEVREVFEIEVVIETGPPQLVFRILTSQEKVKLNPPVDHAACGW